MGAFSIGGAAWRVLSGEENQSFSMPVSITNLAGLGPPNFFKKPLVSPDRTLMMARV